MTLTAIDLFAGAGGLTLGAEMAGIKVIYATNHSKLAVGSHELNHPSVAHECQDLQQANWSRVPAHDLLLAGVCCQGHSNARGKDKKTSEVSRSTAWAVVDCAEYHLPKFIVVENVPEIQKWVLFGHWLSCLEALGYQHSFYVRDAADHGIPQNRVRLFMVFSRTREPLRLLNLPQHPHQPANSFLRWNEGKWSPIIKPGRAAKTIQRIERGRRDLGVSRFLAPYYSKGSGTTGRYPDRPIGTITTRARWSLIDGDMMRMLNVPETKAAQGFPLDYKLLGNQADQIEQIGNAVPPPMAHDILFSLRRAA